jgi:hypothetical protein
MTATTSPATVPLTVSGEYLPDYVKPGMEEYPQRIAFVPDDNDRLLVVPMEII